MSEASGTGMPHLEAAARTWATVPRAAPAGVSDARAQLHHVAQIANSPAVSYLPPAADDSHTNFGWNAALGAFVSRCVPFPQARSFAWRVRDLGLLALDAAAAPVASLSLDGETLARAHAWVREQCEDAGGDAARYTAAKHYTIPPHRVGDGGVFSADPNALISLSTHWAGAMGILNSVAADTSGSSSVRLWPHHFDAGRITRIDDERSIGIGFTPGDEWYDEPYWYATPYPPPHTAHRPPLAAGAEWHEREWFSAVLPWHAYAGAAHQGAAVAAYLESAFRANHQLLASSSQ